MLHLLRISVPKYDLSKRLIHGLEKKFGKSINTCFVFYSDFLSFVARQINFPYLLGAKHTQLNVWTGYVNP